MLPPRKLHPDTLRYDCKENSGVGHPSEFCALKKRNAKNAKMGTPMSLMHVAFVSLQSSASAQSQTHHDLVWECHFQHAPKPLSRLMVKHWGLRCCAIGLRCKCLACRGKPPISFSSLLPAMQTSHEVETRTSLCFASLRQ